MTISAERITEIGQALADTIEAEFEVDRQAFSVGRGAGRIGVVHEELLELCALAAAGIDNLARFTENAENLELKPGDLLIVRTTQGDAPTQRALAAALAALARSLHIRVLAVEASATLEVTPAADLSALAWNTFHRLQAGPVPGEADPQRAYTARVIAEAAGELGLVIKRPERPA